MAVTLIDTLASLAIWPILKDCCPTLKDPRTSISLVYRIVLSRWTTNRIACRKYGCHRLTWTQYLVLSFRDALFASGQCQKSVPYGTILCQDHRRNLTSLRLVVSQTDYFPKWRVIVSDKFVEFAGKIMYVGMDSSVRFLAHSHLLVARSLAIHVRVLNPTKWWSNARTDVIVSPIRQPLRELPIN